MAKRTALGSYLVRRVDPCRAYRVLFQMENLEWLAKPHQLEIPLECLSRPVEVVRRVYLCLCLFRMVQPKSPERLWQLDWQARPVESRRVSPYLCLFQMALAKPHQLEIPLERP